MAEFRLDDTDSIDKNKKEINIEAKKFQPEIIQSSDSHSICEVLSDEESKKVAAKELSINNKIKTMNEIAVSIQNTEDKDMMGAVYEFKLSIIRRTLIRINAMMDAKQKIEEKIYALIANGEIDSYPVGDLLFFMQSMEGSLDRDLKLMQSILPSQDSTSFKNTYNTNITVKADKTEKLSPASVEKINKVIEQVKKEMNKAKEEDNTNN